MRSFLSLLLLVGLSSPWLTEAKDEFDFNFDFDFDLTHSDDGTMVELPFFFLQIFETDGDLAVDTTYANVQNALSQYLTAELNAIYSPLHTVHFINSTVYTDDSVEFDQGFRHLLPESKRNGPSRQERIEWELNRGSLETAEEEKKFLRGKRNLQSIVGSEMLMKVNVTFDRSPAPGDEEVRREVVKMMQDLDGLVPLLTATNDPELANVFLALRMELPTPSPTVLPTSSPAPSSPPSASPVVATASPVVPTLSPVAPTDAPVQPTLSPVTPTIAPVAPTFSPVAPTSAPVVPTLSPVTPTSAPVLPTSSPVAPTTAPVVPTLAPVPVVVTTAPVAPTESPVSPPVAVTTSPTQMPGGSSGNGNPSPPPDSSPTNPTDPGGAGPTDPTSPGEPTSAPGSGGGGPTDPTSSPDMSPSDSTSSPDSGGAGSGGGSGGGGPTDPTSSPDMSPSEPTSSPDSGGAGAGGGGAGGGGSGGNDPTMSPLVLGPTDAPTPSDIPGVGAVIGGERTATNDNNSNTIIIGTVAAVCSAALIAVALFAFMRRRRRNEDEEDFVRASDVEDDIDALNVPMSPMSRSVGNDSIFSGLTDMMNDTGSPRIRQTKSISSATTVQANNVEGNQGAYSMKSPVSMTNASTLFAFSEEGEEEESEQDIGGSDVSVDNPPTPTDQGSKQAGGFLFGLGLGLGQKKAEVADETPLRSNKAADQAAATSSTSRSMGNMASKDSNVPTGALIAGGVVAAAGVTAAATRRRSSKSSKQDAPGITHGGLGSPNSVDSSDGAFPTGRNGKSRHHTGKGQADGTSEYQQAMHPLDWSAKSDVNDEDASTLSSAEDRYARQFLFAQVEKKSPKTPMFSPRSERSKMSSLSGNSTPGSRNSKDSDASASRQLINDLVWLEQKIANVRTSTGAAEVAPLSPGGIDHTDSLSYKSQDAPISPSSHGETSTVDSNGIMQNIVCRDCFAPPGKLNIVIHSTKDGPAVHTVKPGSSLEGHLFPGNLIIAVDNVDTRTFTAEQVMKMMAAKSGFERKITVLHFEN